MSERLIVVTRRLIDELVRDGELEVRGAAAVARKLCEWLLEIERVPTGRDLSDWLEEQPGVDELFADEDLLSRRIEQHLDPVLGAPEPENEARDPELERAILDAPDDPGPYLVYSDWLQEQGDPLGELIAVGIDGDAERFDQLFRKRKSWFLGDFAPLYERALKLGWRHGLVREVSVEESLGEGDWSALFELRILFAVERVRVDTGWSNTFLQGLAELAASAPAGCRALSISGPSHIDLASLPLPPAVRDLELRCVALGCSACPPLDSLALYIARFGEESAAAASWPVRALRLGCRGNAIALLDAVELPDLERVALDLETRPLARERAAHLDRVLDGLRQLAITNGFIDAGLASSLAARAPRLETLELVDLSLSDDDAAAIAERLEGHGSLRALDVSDNELTAAGLDALATLGVEIATRRQNPRGSGIVRRIRRFGGTRFKVAEPLADPKKWDALGAEGDLCWGYYSGTEPYELHVTRDLDDYRCSCPSRDQPCKHVVALALIDARHGLPEKKR